jgi:hypothetical protein
MSLTKATNRMISGAPANVLDFGADPTGTEESTAAINAALAASNQVYFPAGTYTYDGTLTLGSDTVISGESQSSATISFLDNTVDALAFEGTGLRIQNIEISGGLRGLRVGDEASGGGATGAGREIYVEKCIFSGQASIGIDWQKGWNNNFVSSKIFAPGVTGIRLGNGFINSGQFNGIRLLRCGGQYSVTIDSTTSRSIEFYQCVVEGNDTANSVAFKSTGSSNVGITLRECYFETHEAAYIDFSSSVNYGIKIDGCDFSGGSHPGIKDASGMLITSCTFTGDDLEGITNPTSCIIFNCHARTTAGSWSTQDLVYGTITNCLIFNTGDDSDDLGTQVPSANNVTFGDYVVVNDNANEALTSNKNMRLAANVNVDTSSTETLLSTGTGPSTFMVFGTRGSSGGRTFIAHRGSSSVTTIASAGTFAGSLAWSGDALEATSPGAGNTSWSWIRVN